MNRHITYASRPFVYRLLAVVTLAALSVPVLPASAGSPFSRIIVFGDSLSDTHNFFAATGTPAAPYHDGRFCDGPLWVEYLAEQLGMPLLPEDVYAFAGATTGRDNENDNDFDEPIDFPGLWDQLDGFLVDASVHGADPHALYVIWAGANDFVLMAETGGDPAQTIANGVENIATAVYALSSVGARHLLVLNVPDIGLTPLALYSGQAEGLSLLVSLYNNALDEALNQLALAGIPTIRVATDVSLQSMVTEPERYGFTNVAQPYLLVGGDPSEFVFLDALHPTTKAHSILASDALDALVEHYVPASIPVSAAGGARALNGLVTANEQ